jgi:mono/diheme cytochrome c family protein
MKRLSPWVKLLSLGLFTLNYFAFSPVAKAADNADTVSFNNDIRAILSNNCFKCHGPDLRKGKLDLQTLESASQEAESGEKAIVPGKHSASELIRRLLLPASDDAHMPPKGQLTEKQISLLKKWIDQGAKYEEHWSFVPPKKNGQSIDELVQVSLKKQSLTSAPEANRETLIRRLSLDITGLPPSPKEVAEFLQDQSPNAYEKLVDRLLTSQHYGENMARMWLDLARYADTNGYEKDERRTIWPYRDWVIQSFNKDMPYDQFTREQFAGDLLPNSTNDQKIATGFHRNTMVNTEGGTDEEEFRVAAIVDRVNTTMEVWMGLTFACAQCHTHKYDPFTQKEYYQIFAFFNSTQDAGRSMPPALQLPTPEQKAQLNSWKKQKETVNKTLLLSPLAVYAELEKIGKAESRYTVKSTLILKATDKPRKTNVMIRGEFKNLGDEVKPAFPARVSQAKDAGSSRLDLANWLVSERNPLAGRVLANRIWAKFYGRGIVETLEDFGIQGEPPSNQPLLDWLAVELSEKRWSIKSLIKTIVMSQTYRQSSETTPEKQEKDPFNRYFSRGPRLRMDGEMIRDQALAISGLLSRNIGGPSVMPYQPDGVWANPYSGDKWATSKNGDQYRRGLYTFWRRTAPYAMFMAFDAPSREVACSRRPRTNTPLQALAILNDQSFIECANGLAKRMLKEGGNSIPEQIDFAYLTALSRKPSASEREMLVKLLEQNRLRYAFRFSAAKKLANIGNLNAGNAKSESEYPAFEVAARTVIANVLLNLDEVVTKE